MTADIKTAIADEAVRIVTGARRSAYGTPEQNFARIARLWNAHLVNAGLVRDGAGGMQPGDVAAFMRLMKEARLAETPDHLDSYIDLVGYALCGAEVAGVDGSALQAKAEAVINYPPMLKPEPKFKVGDRVRWLGRFNASMLTKDKVYTIKSAPTFPGGTFGVTDDEQDTGAHSWPKELLAENFELIEKAPNPELQIEAGKFYRTRGGAVVGPMRAFAGGSDSLWDVESGSCVGGHVFWSAAGKSDEEAEFDLVEEASGE